MSRTHIPAALRELVRQRADNRCEYCLTPEIAMLESHQLDHIVPEKHDGATAAHNLALACITCNLAKGTDLAAIDPASGRRVDVFHPREQKWSGHFTFKGNRVEALTATGRATARLLQLNSPFKLRQRQFLMAAGLMPPHKSR